MGGGFASLPITVAKDQPVNVKLAKSEAGSETEAPSEPDAGSACAAEWRQHLQPAAAGWNAAEQCKQQQQDVVAADATSEVNCAHLPTVDEINSVQHGVKRERAETAELESVPSVSMLSQVEPVTSMSSAPSTSSSPSMCLASMHGACVELLQILRIEKQRMDDCQRMFIDIGDGDDAEKANEHYKLEGVSQDLDMKLARVDAWLVGFTQCLAENDPANGV